MIKKKSTTIVWPYTPEPSPPLEPSVYSLEDVQGDFTMPSDDIPRARPISMAARKEGALSPGGRPTLEDVLSNRAPPPYTLAAYTAFLSQQHCLETLEFTTEAKKYGEKYDEASANLAGMPLTIDTEEGYDLIQDWSRLLDIYIKPGAPREINLPAEERDALVRRRFDARPPQPETLDAAVKRMYDLMSDSIFIPFCNSLKKSVPYPQTYHVMSDFDNLGDLEPSRTFDERAMHRRMPSRRHRSPQNPNTSAAMFEPSRSPPIQHRPTQSSSLTSALGRQSGARLSTHVSHSSAVSEGALTDSSGGPESPSAGEHDTAITPPTTPPTSELSMGGASHSSGTASSHVAKTQRSESGGWKKAMKFLGGGKKKNGGFNE